MSDRHKLTGPLENGDFPTRLRARVISPGAQPKVHGYDVERDLARHYRFTDLVYLLLTGELPSSEAAAGFEVALCFLAPVSVAHASTHASVLARLCGASTSTTIGVSATALGEQARVTIAEHEGLLRWLDAPSEPFPARYAATEEADLSSLECLKVALLPTGLDVPGLAARPTRHAALLILLRACGLKRKDQLELLLVLARLPAAMSEAFAERATNFGNYPINLPAFSYEDPA